MHAPQLVAEVSRLIQLEVDAIEAYRAAIELVGAGPLGAELSYFRLEHQRRAIELSEVVVKLGYHPPEITPDVKGVVIGALTPPSRTPTAEEVLEAMRGNEQLTGSVYAKALAKPFPKGVLELLQRARADERQHLEWVERAISRRLWEHADVAHP